MANDGNNSRVRRMNLNLYPVPPSPPHMSSNPRFDSYLRYSLNQTLYNPVSQSNEPVLQVDDDPYVPESPSHASYCPYSPLYSPPVSPSRYSPSSPASVEMGEPLVQDNDPYIPYSPSNVLNPQTPNFPTQGRDEYSPAEPSVQIDRYPEANFPRWRGFMRRLGPAVLNRLNSDSGFRRRDSSSAGLISRATDSPRAETRENAIPIDQDRVYDIGDRSIEISDTYEGNTREVVAEYLHKGMKGQSNGVANFECNVCLDMAKEPVVTLCGHLFCWPCLYQWLHLHSDTKECPVCKGEVTDSNIIPIYGRGSPANQGEINHDEEEGSSSKVPPRPHGHRIESLRQRIHRSFPRRLVDEIRSWRRNADNETQNGNRMEGHGERNGRENFDSASRRSPARVRLARWLQRENSEQGLNLFDDSHVDGPDGGSRGSSVVRDRANVWRQLTLNRLQTSERLEAIRASISNVESILARFDRITSRRNHSTPSTSVNHQDPELLHDQDSQRPMTAMDRASVSSTSAVIEGDIGALNTSVGPNALGFSPALRRRRRNGGTSSSFDVDGEVYHAQKRRRSN